MTKGDTIYILGCLILGVLMVFNISLVEYEEVEKNCVDNNGGKILGSTCLYKEVAEESKFNEIMAYICLGIFAVFIIAMVIFMPFFNKTKW